MICSQEVTAFGRLEFLTPLQLAGMHAQMNFLAQAFRAHMPNPSNMSDPCTLSRLKARTGKEVFADRNRGAEVVVICGPLNSDILCELIIIRTLCNSCILSGSWFLAL